MTIAAASVVTAAPPSAEARLAYVLRHFRLAYEHVPDVTIGYAGAQPAVTVADGAGDFFFQATPYPPLPTWRLWQDQRLPFFFEAHPTRPLLELGPGTAQINSDIISAAFYLLSGWQEYFSEERDWYGRFTFAVSMQRKHRFVDIPMVNYYFDVLKTAVEHVTGQPLPPRRWGPQQAPFAAFITHDVDNLHGGWGIAMDDALHRREYRQLLGLLRGKLKKQPAPWNNLEQVQATVASYGAPSTFFMLTSPRRAANGVANADYDLADPALAPRLAALEAAGAEIAAHGSFGTATDAAKLQAEATPLAPLAGRGNRFHYLHWDPRRTPQAVAEAGFAYDSTLGFAEHFGFRNSYCLPFYPWDFERNQAHAFLEIPLTVMDTTLNHARYLQLAAAQILPGLRRTIDEVQRFGGVFTVLWHNQNFDPANDLNGPKQFAGLMADLVEREVAFVTGNQVVVEMNG